MTTSPDQPPPQPGVTFEQLVRALQATVDDLVKQVSELRLRQEEQAEQLKQLEGPPAPLPASLTSPLTMFLRWDATKGRRLFGFSAGAPDPIHPLGALKTNDLAHLMPWRCEALLGLVVDLLSLEIVKGLERHAGEGPGARLSCHWIWTRAIFRRGPAEASPEGPSGDQRLRRGRSREHPASAFRTDLSRLKNVLADVFLMDMTDKPFPRARQGEDVRPLTITTDDFGAEQDQRESWTPVFGVFAQLFELEDAVGRCAADPAQIEPHLRRLLESDPANLGTLWRMAESNLAPPAGLAAALALCVADRREDLVEMLRGAEEDMPYLSLPRDLLAALTKLAARLSAPGPLPVPPRTGWQDPEALEARVTDACLAL